MADVITLERKKFLVARGSTADAKYLRLFGSRYDWVTDPKLAMHFDDEIAAGSMAGRIAGGAVIAEVVIV